VRPELYASIREKGRGRPKVAEAYSVFSVHVRRHRRPQSEAEPLEMQAEVVNGRHRIIGLPQHDHLRPGKHREHLVHRGGPRELLDEAPPVRMHTRREEGVDVDDDNITSSSFLTGTLLSS